MTIRNGVDLGASFDRLKKAFKESDELMKGEGVIAAYSRLYVNVEKFVKDFDDLETLDDLQGVLMMPGEAENNIL